jgi:hypothetical protein
MRTASSTTLGQFSSAQTSVRVRRPPAIVA